MSGATSRQLFWQVRVPNAKKQLLLGLNQTTMASLSMVIIASIIGGTADIGWEVLSQIRKAQFGESLLAGLVIALIAMLIDRVTSGFANHSSNYQNAAKTSISSHAYLLFAIFGSLLLYLLAMTIPTLDVWPREMEASPAPKLILH